MEKENIFSFRVKGRNALFTDPLSKTGGERTSLLVPTPQALIGIIESIYWKPTLIYEILAYRVINPILSETKGIRPINYSGGNDLSYVTYLCDVEYEVKARFLWNENRPDLQTDRIEDKHFFILKRSIEKGGRRDVFLGTRECAAVVEPCAFGEKSGYYDHYGDIDFGIQFHSFLYPDENNQGKLITRLWRPVMRDGKVEVCKPQDCEWQHEVKDMNMKSFIMNKNMLPVTDEEEIRNRYVEEQI